METLTVPAQANNEQVINETLTVVPEFMTAILAARELEDKQNEDILAGLKQSLKDAKKADRAANEASDDELTEETAKTAEAVKIASDKLAQFAKTVELSKLQRQADDTANLARYDIAEKFGVNLELIDKLVEASKDVKDSLKSSFNTLFGKPVVFAKAGQTGKDLSKSVPKSNGEVKVSLNGNPEKAGSKRAEIWDDLVAGMTYDQLLEKYPTEGNSQKLNGTARTVISDHKFKKQADNSYQIVSE